jgi:imidazole glycerol-phosphate synthase subunit HisH
VKVAIVDYGMGNLASVARAIKTLGHEPFIAQRPSDLEPHYIRLIVPGVGAFGEAMARLSSSGWVPALQEFVVREQTRVLGICLGMQLLATRGTEHGDHAGLNLIAGEVIHLRELGVEARIPHIGWNSISIERQDLLLDGIADDTDFYFVHSYGFVADSVEHCIATTSYGASFNAIIGHGNIWGTQFHPEKSSKAGMQLLSNFVDAPSC